MKQQKLFFVLPRDLALNYAKYRQTNILCKHFLHCWLCVGSFVDSTVAVVEDKVDYDHGEISDVEVYDEVHAVDDLVQDACGVTYDDDVGKERAFALGCP